MNFERPKLPEKAKKLLELTAIGLVAAALHGGVLALGSATEIARSVRKELNSGDEQELIELGQKLAESEQRIISPFEFVANAELIEQGVSQDDVASARVDHQRVVNAGLYYKDTGEPVPVVLNYLLTEQGEYKSGQRSMVDAYNTKLSDCYARLAKLTGEAAEIFPEYYALGWIQGQTFNGVDGDGDGKYETAGVDTEPHARLTMQVDATHRYIVEGQTVEFETITTVDAQPTTMDISRLLITSYLAEHNLYTQPSSLKGLVEPDGPKPIFRYPGSPVDYTRSPNAESVPITITDEPTTVAGEQQADQITLDLARYRQGNYDLQHVGEVDAAVLIYIDLHPSEAHPFYSPEHPLPAHITIRPTELTADIYQQYLASPLNPNPQYHISYAPSSISLYTYIKDPAVVALMDPQLRAGRNIWKLPLASPAAARAVAERYDVVSIDNLNDLSVAYELAHGKVNKYNTDTDLKPEILRTLLAGGKIKRLWYQGNMTAELAKVINEYPLDELSMSCSVTFTPEAATTLAGAQLKRLEIFTFDQTQDPAIYRALFAAEGIQAIELSTNFDAGFTPEQSAQLAQALSDLGVTSLTTNETVLASLDFIAALRNSSVKSLKFHRFADDDHPAAASRDIILRNVEQLEVDQLIIGGVDDRPIQTADLFIALSKSKIKQIVFTHEYSAEQVAWIRQYLPNATFGRN